MPVKCLHGQRMLISTWRYQELKINHCNCSSAWYFPGVNTVWMWRSRIGHSHMIFVWFHTNKVEKEFLLRSYCVKALDHITFSLRFNSKNHFKDKMTFELKELRFCLLLSREFSIILSQYSFTDVPVQQKKWLCGEHTEISHIALFHFIHPPLI